MNGLNGFARLLLQLANWIAGPDREEWTLAMAVEADAANRHGTQWALGCLLAAGKDRFAREWWFVASMVMLPVLALILVVASAAVIFVGARALGVSGMAGIPLMLFGPLPAAWVLGRMRPNHASALVGTIAFVIHQAFPMILMWAMFGSTPHFWYPNMVYYNMPAYAGLFMSWLVWVAGTWWGASGGRRSRL